MGPSGKKIGPWSNLLKEDWAIVGSVGVLSVRFTRLAGFETRLRLDRIQNGFHRVLRHGSHLVVGSILDGMRDIYGRRGDSESRGLSFSRFHKFVGGDKNAGNAAFFQVDYVVHTARRAGTSVGQGFNHHTALGTNGLSQFKRSYSGKSRFFIAFDGQTPISQ